MDFFKSNFAKLLAHDLPWISDQMIYAEPGLRCLGKRVHFQITYTIAKLILEICK